MISVQNRLQLLSGNRLIIALFFIAFLASCSPKVVVTESKKQPVPPVKEQPKVTDSKKEVSHSIALLLPFQLDNINSKTAALKDITQADLAIDFYQGFKLALDSLSL